MLASFLSEVKRGYKGPLPECCSMDGSFEFKDGMGLFEITFANDCNVLLCMDTCSPDTCCEYDEVSIQKAAKLFVEDFIGKKWEGANNG